MTDVDSTVTRLRRPAVHVSTLVRSDAAHTFDVFVRTIGAWWPVQPMSAGKERVRDVTIEPAVGGRVFETWDDGTTVDWGEVLVWEPAACFAMTWRSTPVVTEVELTFTQLGAGLTRVTVEHRGWEALTDEQLAEDCARPGGYSAGAFDGGWRHVLDLLGAAVERGTDDGLPTISDEYMRDMLTKTKAYTVVLLKDGPNRTAPDADTIVWEHGRRNFALRAHGELPIVCPILDDSHWDGVGIFDRSTEEATAIMDGDPGVLAGIFTYEVHPVRSFPGSQLP